MTVILKDRKTMDSYQKLCLEKVSEYYQEIPQSHTVDQPTHGTMRKRHRTLTATRHQEDQLSLPQRDDCKTRKDTKFCITK